MMISLFLFFQQKVLIVAGASEQAIAKIFKKPMQIIYYHIILSNDSNFFIFDSWIKRVCNCKGKYKTKKKESLITTIKCSPSFYAKGKK